MKQIRQGVFETNSSSTHSICIAKDNNYTIPKSVSFEFGEFGWEHNTLDSIYKKASYVYTGFVANNRVEDFKQLLLTLEEKGIEYMCEEPVYEKYTYKGNDGRSYISNGGYVDHSERLTELLDDLVANPQLLLNYLFSPLSFIITGNDNNDSDVSIDVIYEYDEYYKGN